MSAVARMHIGSPVRLLSALLVALALLVSPIAMVSASAAASADASAAGSDIPAHCAGTDAPSGHDMPDAGMSCTASCAACPALPPIIGEPLDPTALPLSIAPQKRLAAIALEGETPPPRMTPRI